jgi:hypothetical protein
LSIAVLSNPLATNVIQFIRKFELEMGCTIGIIFDYIAIRSKKSQKTLKQKLNCLTSLAATIDNEIPESKLWLLAKLVIDDLENYFNEQQDLEIKIMRTSVIDPHCLHGIDWDDSESTDTLQLVYNYEQRWSFRGNMPVHSLKVVMTSRPSLMHCASFIDLENTVLIGTTSLDIIYFYNILEYTNMTELESIKNFVALVF